MRVEDYVSNLRGVESEIYPKIKMAKRKGNQKREFLFFNTVLGKHVPTLVDDISMQYIKLAEKIQIDEQICSVLVIGFAETATLLGRGVFEEIRERYAEKMVHYTETTRNLRDLEVWVEFEEEHSHATTQRLYRELNMLPQYDLVIFVEDEISTGNTIKNTIEKLESSDILVNHYIVASVLAWNTRNIDTQVEWKKKKSVRQVSIISGDLIPNVVYEDNLRHHKIQKKYTTGSVVDIEQLSADIVESNIQKILVLGFEADMWETFRLARKLQDIDGVHVKHMATTRSPIEIIANREYPVQNRFEVTAWNGDYTTFLYEPQGGFDTDIVLTILPKGRDVMVEKKIRQELNNIFADRVIFIEDIK